MNEFMPGVSIQPQIEQRNIADLINWEHNPRTVKKADMTRLKEQIKLLGMYKPLLINQENIVLGGNMRLQALRELGVETTLCSVVKTDNAAQMMDYALSDNDQIGVTDEQVLANYAKEHQMTNTQLFAINSSPMKLVSTALKQFEPNKNDNPSKQLDYYIKISFTDLSELENCLVEVQEMIEHYNTKGVSVNDGSKD